MTKPFTTPFAADAPDNLFIPETAQPDGSVSYETGFGPDYSKDPLENGAKPVPRKGHNELFFQITGSIGDIQRQGAADWYPEFAADGGYPKNAIVWLDGDRWKSQIDANATRPNIDEIAWLPSAKFEGGGSGGGGGGDFGLTGPTTIAVGGSFHYKISPYSSFMTYAVSATNGTATISGDTITLTIAPGETANVTDLTVVRSDGARNDFRIAIGAQSIAKPSMLSPASGSVDVPLGPLLTASAFMTYPVGADTHLNTDWRIRTMAGAVVWQSLANAVNKTNIQVPDNTLPLNTQLQADVRYRGAALPVSAWSDQVVFTTTNQSISTPTITAPLNGAIGIGATPTFTATAFSTNPLGADTHASSDWQLKNSLGVVIWSSVADVVNKTSITLPSGVLAVSSQYTMEVRYNGNVLQTSQWSPVVSFTTAAQFAYDKYLAVGFLSPVTAKPINLYGQDVDTFNLLPTPPVDNSNQVNDISFSSDGLYVALALNDAPFISIYKRSGDNLVKMATPSIAPTGAGRGISFGKGSDFLLVAHEVSPFFTFYKRNGEIFEKRANPETLPNGLCTCCAFSPDGKTFALGSSAGTRINIYEATPEGVLTRSTDPSKLPTGSMSALRFSADGIYLSAGFSAGEFIINYKWNGTRFVALPAPSAPPASGVLSLAYSPDSTYLAFSTSNTTGRAIFVYKRAGDSYNLIATANVPLVQLAQKMAFSSDGTKLALGQQVSPFLAILSRSGDVFTRLADVASPPPRAGNAVAFYPPVPGV